jgi:CheY-like chemotaxis protein
MTSLLDISSVGADGLNLADLDLIVVEDNDFTRNLLTKILRSLGCSDIRGARNGKEAIDCLAAFPTDILVTDWMMSPIDGIALTKFVRTSNISPNPFLPIIMVTACTSPRDVLVARDAGVTEMLAQPVSAQALYGKIRRLILHPRPFVRTASFFGPDRRRRETRDYRGLERRGNDVTEAVSGMRASVGEPRARQRAHGPSGASSVFITAAGNRGSVRARQQQGTESKQDARGRLLQRTASS